MTHITGRCITFDGSSRNPPACSHMIGHRMEFRKFKITHQGAKNLRKTVLPAVSVSATADATEDGGGAEFHGVDCEIYYESHLCAPCGTKGKFWMKLPLLLRRTLFEILRYTWKVCMLEVGRGDEPLGFVW